MQYLHPLFKDHKMGSTAISSIAKKLPHVINEEQLPTLKHEWFDYSTSEITAEWSKDENGNNVRIDHYWNKVTELKSKSGLLKYPVMMQVIKSALTISHGNADVERSLSDNKNTVTPERASLGMETINGLRLAKDQVSRVKGVHHIQISNKRVSMARKAKGMYEERVRKEKEESERKERALQEKKGK
ncbi:hypothetical protein DPMN_057689 [Dreissena polymorpha]|uniref:Uncharacterized protein n=1 Tax=Dreissena polymorpha TaxID=45954 RepID=A0A9D4C0E6_DREPO|nr:hypothetical protein DPMN_057689 [Dreissena polymorpha]